MEKLILKRFRMYNDFSKVLIEYYKFLIAHVSYWCNSSKNVFEINIFETTR